MELGGLEAVGETKRSVNRANLVTLVTLRKGNHWGVAQTRIPRKNAKNKKGILGGAPRRSKDKVHGFDTRKEVRL